MELEEYLDLMEKKIKDILNRKEKNNISFDILDTEDKRRNKLIYLKEKQYLMKIGEIWQEVLGNYNGFINLKTGHSSGLDIISYDKKVIIELKNRINTDNSSSRKTNLDKLVEFKRKHPEFRCIYGFINANTEKDTLQGGKKIIQYRGIEIEYYYGMFFLHFIFGKDTNRILSFLKSSIHKYT